MYSGDCTKAGAAGVRGARCGRARVRRSRGKSVCVMGRDTAASIASSKSLSTMCRRRSHADVAGVRGDMPEDAA